MTASAGPTVRLAPMRRRHLREVLTIERQVYPRPWTYGLYLSELANSSTRSYWVASGDGGTILGYGGAMITDEEGHVTTLAVDPGHQGKGVATRLLLQVTVDVLRMGARRMTLEVRTSNERARRLYAHFGYVPMGTRRNYYPETKEDAVIMTAADVATREYVERLQRIATSLPGRTIVVEQKTRMPG